jgi:hypothetical protein
MFKNVADGVLVVGATISSDLTLKNTSLGLFEAAHSRPLSTPTSPRDTH